MMITHTHDKRVVALLLAGGMGTRFSALRPKQYIEVDGLPIIAYTMRAFERHMEVTDIYVVCMPQWEDYMGEVAMKTGLKKYRGSLPSGDTSFESLANGIRGLSEAGLPEDSIILVHDAVRPLVSQATITDNISTCRYHGSAITVVYSNEAYMEVDGSNHSVGFAPRERFMRAQTPHTFPLATLCSMMHEARERGITCSQSLFTLANELGRTPLYIALGETTNLKITRPEDLRIFRALVND